MFQGNKVFESMYRVDRYHQFLPNRGNSGKGLIQFFGPRAKRVYQEGTKPGPWEVGPEDQKHTVELGGVMHDFKLTRRKRKK
jgi:hypothetical protein